MPLPISVENPQEAPFFGLEGERLSAALTVDRPVLVLAGPGAGKTHLLVAHTVFLSSRRQGRVIQLTFSRNAAAELEKRTRLHLDEHAKRRLLSGTIHSYALSLLESYGWILALGRPIQILEDNKDVEAFCREVAAKRREPLPEGFASHLERALRRQTLSSADLAGETLLGEVLVEMRKAGSLTWSMTLHLALELLRTQAGVLASLQHHNPFVLLDEAQDCDRLQLDFIKTFVGGNHLFVAMDPDQSLYAFRDADPESVLAWARSFNPAVFELTENYRCTPRIQALARFILGDLRAVGGEFERGTAHLLFGRNKEGEANYIALEIEKRLQAGLAAERMAVLGRHNYVIEPVIEALKSKQLPIRIRETADYDAAEEKILAALVLLHGWSEGLPWTENSHKLWVAVFDSQLPDLMGGYPTEDPNSNSKWQQLCKALEGSTPGSLVRSAAEILGIEIIAGRSSLLVLAQECRRLSQLLQQARSGSRKAIGTHGVLVTTFHGAKGLEFDVVFLVGCEDGVIPDYRATKDQELKQERRALYVALTRAAQEVVVTGARQDGNRTRKPCRFLPPKGSAIWSSAVVAP